MTERAETQKSAQPRLKPAADLLPLVREEELTPASLGEHAEFFGTPAPQSGEGQRLILKRTDRARRSARAIALDDRLRGEVLEPRDPAADKVGRGVVGPGLAADVEASIAGVGPDPRHILPVTPV